MKKFSDESCRENKHTHTHTHTHTEFMLNNFFSTILPFVTWKNFVEPGRLQSTTWCMRVACWVPRATDTHPECVIHPALSLQHWLKERSFILTYMNTDCLITI